MRVLILSIGLAALAGSALAQDGYPSPAGWKQSQPIEKVHCHGQEPLICDYTGNVPNVPPESDISDTDDPDLSTNPWCPRDIGPVAGDHCMPPPPSVDEPTATAKEQEYEEIRVAKAEPTSWFERFVQDLRRQIRNVAEREDRHRFE
jgi:hypothetical protein